MMFFAVTKPKKKLLLGLKLVLLAVLIGLVVPTIYYGLSDAGAMESFMQALKPNQPQTTQEQPVILTAEAQQLQAAIQQETIPGEPIRVTGNTAPNIPKTEPQTSNQAAVTDQKAKQADTKQDTAKQENTKDANVEENPDVEQPKAEKSGIIQKLKELIFGKEPKVEIYTK